MKAGRVEARIDLSGACVFVSHQRSSVKESPTVRSNCHSHYKQRNRLDVAVLRLSHLRCSEGRGSRALGVGKQGREDGGGSEGYWERAYKNVSQFTGVIH